MGKNVYSLVLSSDVINAVDRMAYRLNTSRSNLINQILAEYVSCPTPEMRAREVLRRAEGLLTALNEPFQLLLQPTDTLLSLRSALTYKYNPTIRYALELYGDSENSLGELRAALRTQNETLIRDTNRFYSVWMSLEQRHDGIADSSKEAGRFRRKLRKTSSEKPLGADEIAQMISDYVRAFDGAMKTFFANLDDLAAAEQEVSDIYLLYRRTRTGFI